MKILKLTAENIKRLKAVEIVPDADGTLVMVTGRNDQGKTSVLDSIWYALGGKDTVPPRPIRYGEDHAEVTIDLGDLIVTRTWTSNDKTYLKVLSRDGAKYPSPQKMLDDLIGSLSFDPLGFSRMPAKKQREILIECSDIGMDLDAYDVDRRILVENRRDAGRDLKAEDARLAGMAVPDADALDVPISTGVAAERYNEAVAADQYAANLLIGVSDAKKDVLSVHDTIKKTQAKLDLQLDLLERAEQKEKALSEKIQNLPPSKTAEARAALDQVESANLAHRAAIDYLNATTNVSLVKARHDKIDSDIKELDEARDAALKSANLPITGLGISDDGVTFDDVPFCQLSSSKQLKVSMAMAMALNPLLRVIRVTDGSLLDSESLAVIEKMASEKDYQVWVEAVHEDDQVGIVIEDGLVKSVSK